MEKKGNIRRLHEPKWGRKRRGKEEEREGKKRDARAETENIAGGGTCKPAEENWKSRETMGGKYWCKKKE